MLCVVLSGELAVCCCCACSHGLYVNLFCRFWLVGLRFRRMGTFGKSVKRLGGYNGYTIVWSKNAKSVWVCVTIFVFSVF